MIRKPRMFTVLINRGVCTSRVHLFANGHDWSLAALLAARVVVACWLLPTPDKPKASGPVLEPHGTLEAGVAVNLTVKGHKQQIAGGTC